jgi:3-oxoadipate enol-lactonase
MDRLGRDVLELLDGLGVQRANFCGLSMGGMVGQWLGLRAPERLTRMVLANTSAFMGPPTDWDKRIGLVRENGMSALAEAVLERWLTPSFRAASPDAVQTVRGMLLATAPSGYAGCCAAIRDMDMRRLIKLISVPTLVIGGAQDPATPPGHAELLADEISQSSLVMLKAAHLSNVEQPLEFTRAVLSHLT